MNDEDYEAWRYSVEQEERKRETEQIIREKEEEERAFEYYEGRLFFKCVLEPNGLRFGSGLWMEEWTGFRWEIKEKYR